MGTRFPAALLGGELLATMSAQLRELLQHSASSAQTSGVLSGRRRFETENPARAQERAWLEESLRRRAASDFASLPAVESQTPPAGALGPATRSGRSLSDAQEATALDQRPKGLFQETHRANAAVEEASPSVSLSAGRRQDERPGTIARQVREYWELERRLRNARLATDNSQETHAASPGPAMEAHPNSVPLSRRPEGQAVLARRLKAFVSGESKEHIAGRPAWASATDTTSETSSLKETSFASLAGAPPADFADRLANVLRWQATQHGIDLT